MLATDLPSVLLLPTVLLLHLAPATVQVIGVESVPHIRVKPLLPHCRNSSHEAADVLRANGLLPLSVLEEKASEDVAAMFWAGPLAQKWGRHTANPVWVGPRNGKTCAGDLHGTVAKLGLWEFVRMYKCNNNKIRAMMKRWPQPKQRTRFTFVRDPIRRFVSGYRELEFRYRCRSDSRAGTLESSPLTFLREPPGSPRRAEIFLREFLGPNETHWTRYNPLGAYGHLCPFITAPGFDKNVFVGKIEDMKGSLIQLARVAGLDVDLYTGMDELPRHPSEFDVIANVEKTAMARFLERSPSWVWRLVARYTPDICAFGYNRTQCPDSPDLDGLRSKVVPLYS